MKKIILPMVLAFSALPACNDDDSSSEVAATTEPTDEEAATVVGSLAIALSSLNGTSASLAGIPTDYCNASGGALASDGSELGTTDAGFGPGTAHCTVAFNAQSSDTGLGALYWVNAFSCLGGVEEMFTDLTVGEVKTKTATIAIDETCFGTAEEVAALQADMGGMTEVEGIEFESEKLADDAEYDFRLKISRGEGAYDEMYIKNSSTVISALILGTEDGSEEAKFVSLDTSAETAVFNYELVNGQWGRRIRIAATGTMTDGQFTTVNNVEGFQMNGETDSNDDLVGLSWFSTFQGDFTTGTQTTTYTGNDAGTVNSECGLYNGETADCTGVDGLTSSAAEALALYNALESSIDALQAATNTAISFDSVDTADVDVVN